MDEKTCRAFWIRAPGHGEIVEGRLGPRQEHEVLVRAGFSGISRGSEALVFRGEVPPSQHEAMRAPFQEGDFPGPLKYGYSSVGTVVEGPPHLEGRDVFCLYPHQDLYRVPADAVAVLPSGVPPERAVLAANVETALNAVWDGHPGPGDRVLVVGAGVVGLLIGWLCAGIPGTEVVVHDIDATRAEPAGALGLDFTDHAPDGMDADLVVHASGHPEGLPTALANAGVEALVLELSWYGTRPVELPLGEAFHSRRITIRSSQVGRIPSGRLPRWDHRRRMATALRLLRDDRLDVLISGESTFDELPDTLEALSNGRVGALCHRIRYPLPSSKDT